MERKDAFTKQRNDPYDRKEEWTRNDQKLCNKIR